MFQLETPRLLIRPWTRADRSGFTAMSSDPAVMRYVHRGVPFSDAEVDDFMARQEKRLAEDDLCMGAMVEKASGRVVGVAGIQPLGTTGELEIGWWVASDCWGRGFATEAGRAAMEHVLGPLGRERVLAIIDPGNEPSVRVAMRLGMSLDRRVTGRELGHRLPEIVVDLFIRERSASESA